MKIHEITRRPVEEGILKGIKTAAQTAGRAIAALPTTMAYNVLDRARAATGIDVNPRTPGAGTASGRQEVAGRLSGTLVKPTAKRQAQIWDQSLNSLAKTYGMPGTPRWPTPLVRDDMDQMINQVLLRNQIDWKDLASTFASDPDRAASAQDIENSIIRARQQILSFTPTVRAGTLYSADALESIWEDLVTAAFDAQNLVISSRYGTTSSGGGTLPVVTFTPSGIPLFDGMPFNPSDPRHVAAKRALGIP